MALPNPFQAEPAFAHGSAPHTAVLLCNLGTPQAPTPAALRTYLAEFLSDHRVVEIPKLLWWPILHGIILRLRPAKSAAKYASIWTPQGSPLMAWTQQQTALLQTQLSQAGHRVQVRCAMRYGQPSIAQALDALKATGATRVLVLPAYPQYASATSASVFDAVYAWASKTRRVPELRFVNHYHDHPGYIAALAARIQGHWHSQGRAAHLLMSFHGVPERTLHLGDPYHCECHKTARLLAQELGLHKGEYSVTFQSRFGKAKWLEPYTEPTLRALAPKLQGRLDVVCPGFVSDCLETLEEIAMEGRHAFMESGGKDFAYIPCLNDSGPWIAALADIASQHLGGWPTRADPAANAQALGRSREAALALGASQ
ncbi:MAG: ferrochelatase [Burkholderiales bacterium]|mgnify:CR=1 FL=1